MVGAWRYFGGDCDEDAETYLIISTHSESTDLFHWPKGLIWLREALQNQDS